MLNAPQADPTPAPSATPATGAAAPSSLEASLAEMERSLGITGPAPQPVDDATPPVAPEATAEADQPEDAEPPSAAPAEQAPDATDTPDQQRKPSRREAARLAEQLTQAEQRARELQAQAETRQLGDRQALQQFVELVLPEDQFESLRQKAEQGDWEARDKIAVARAWRQMAAPLYQAAQQSLLQSFARDFSALRALDGMDEKRFETVRTADPIAAMREMHAVGKRAAEESAREEIEALKARISELQTRNAAHSPQPASPNGRSESGPLGLGGLVDERGLLTEEALNLGPDQLRRRFVAS